MSSMWESISESLIETSTTLFRYPNGRTLFQKTTTLQSKVMST